MFRREKKLLPSLLPYLLIWLEPMFHTFCGVGKNLEQMGKLFFAKEKEDLEQTAKLFFV